MAVFESEFKTHTFYVDGVMKQFSNGRYSTDLKEEIEVISKLAYVTKVEEVVEKVEEPQVEVEEKTSPKKKPSTK